MRKTVPIQSMRWHNVCVRVRGDGSGPPKLLLKDICGAALPGDMVALLGPSGEPDIHPCMAGAEILCRLGFLCATPLFCERPSTVPSSLVGHLQQHMQQWRLAGAGVSMHACMNLQASWAMTKRPALGPGLVVVTMLRFYLSSFIQWTTECTAGQLVTKSFAAFLACAGCVPRRTDGAGSGGAGYCN